VLTVTARTTLAEGTDALDLRLLVPAGAAWAAALVATTAPGRVTTVLGVLVVVAVAVAVRHCSAPRAWLALGSAVLALAVLAIGGLQKSQLARDPLSGLADATTTVQIHGVVVSDPRVRSGRFADYAMLHLRVEQVAGRGNAHRVRARVLVLGDPGWREVPLGTRVAFRGIATPADDSELAGVIRARGSPQVLEEADVWWRAAAAVRSALRASVAHRPADQRALVPALVVGDDAGMAPDLEDDFRTTGLTHLTAVSGTNLTLLVGFLIVGGRWLGVRGRGVYALALIGIGGFLLLARTEPSVVRAAAMGSVALIGLGSNGRSRGTRALGAAVIALLLLDPDMSRSVGFVLSVLATGGILLLGPACRDALNGWLPRWLAEAIAIPLAAQLACTPVVAAISGQVSLVAVAANLAVAPVVGPVTVLGLLGGLAGMIWAPAGALFGTLAAICAGWIVRVAEIGARLPGAAVTWDSGAWSVGALTLLCLLMAGFAPTVLRRRRAALAFGLLSALVLFARPPSPGWPPDDWVLIACDVGQGDALVLNAGHGRGVLVDAGPDPAAVDRCLGRAGIRSVPRILLTHDHADHVDGLPGVIEGRTSGSVQRAYGPPERLGDLTWQPVWPADPRALLGLEGSAANNASVVWLVEKRGVRILLTGDIEPAAQARLARLLPGLQVDVLKVPHHGSRYQDLDFLTSLGAGVAVVSVGADNDYGHPAPQTLAALEATGARVLRTDLEGDVAIIPEEGAISVLTSR
jgi:competence protein ComEC